MQLGKLVKQVDASYRDAKYVLERGHADRWVRRTLGTGHHRDMSLGEAYALALLLQLKHAGLRMNDAERVVELVEESIRGVARQLSWDPRFAPFAGQLRTEFQWIAEIGDMKAYRLATDANPLKAGAMEEFDWVTLSRRRRVLTDFRPTVTVRVDLTRLVELITD